MIDYYAKRASHYELIYARPERQEDLQRLRERVVGQFRGRRVLELACGTGYWTELLAGTALGVVAVDRDPISLSLASARGVNERLTKFCLGDAYALPFARGSFDAGLAAFWWSHVPRPRLREFLREFHRVLARGATVVFLDNHADSGRHTDGEPGMT